MGLDSGTGPQKNVYLQEKNTPRAIYKNVGREKSRGPLGWKNHTLILFSHTQGCPLQPHTSHIKTSGKTRAGTGPGKSINQRRAQINSQKQQLEKDNLARVVF